MFDRKVYILRRAALKRRMGKGLLLFLGNEESPMNYPDNHYAFRQDSTFLYYFGLHDPGLAALIDVEEDRVTLFGPEATLDDVVWTGPVPSVADRARSVGIVETGPPEGLADRLAGASRQGRSVQFLPQYRMDNRMKLEHLLGIRAASVNRYVSRPFIEAVIAQRSVKAEEEVREIEDALAGSHAMHTLAMRVAKPGMPEQEVVGQVEGEMRRQGRQVAFPIIFSVHGETLHNHSYNNIMDAGRLVVHDSGTTSPCHYTSDITRTFPVSGRFTTRQREVYEVVLGAQQAAIAAVRPGALFKDIHLLACRHMTQGLKDLGLMRGDVEEAVAAGAHAVFFQCGLGHMMGLDVHDMEGLGEDLVGYDGAVRRSPQFGLCYLRLAKALEPGYVVTVEPGVYFIPTLLDRWRAEKKCEAFIDYDAFDAYRDFGGVRVEDDVLVTAERHRVLGPPIPLTVAEVEETASPLGL